MPGQQFNNSGKPFLKIIGGHLAHTVDKDTAGAKLREYELKDGTKGSKWELNYSSWTGTIRGIEFKESDFGESCVIELDDAFFTLNVASRYFRDFGCKIFSANLDNPITFHPYDWEVDGKRKTGISMQQGGEKLKNYFYDGKKNFHGYPEKDEAQKAKLKKSYWKVYFTEVADFLIEKVKEIDFMGAPIADDESPPESEKEIDTSKLPF